MNTSAYVTDLVLTKNPLDGALELGVAVGAFIYALSLSNASPAAQGQVVGGVLLEVFRRHPQLGDELKAGIQIALDNADKIMAGATPYVEEN